MSDLYEGYGLYLFDIDGTIIRSFLREGAPRSDYDLVELLPHRRGVIHGLLRHANVALVTNQGGVAMGYQEPAQVCRKITHVLAALALPEGVICCDSDGRDYRASHGIPLDLSEHGEVQPVAYVAFHHPQARRDRWRRDDDWRKPGGGMLEAAMSDYRIWESRTLYVGDMDSDCAAAAAAGVAYADATDFFGSGNVG